MPMVIEGPLLRIEGVARVEEADTLVAHLVEVAEAQIDLSQASHLHTALLQVLMAWRPAIADLPQDPGLRGVLRALLSDPTPNPAAQSAA